EKMPPLDLILWPGLAVGIVGRMVMLAESYFCKLPCPDRKQGPIHCNARVPCTHARPAFKALDRYISTDKDLLDNIFGPVLVPRPREHFFRDLGAMPQINFTKSRPVTHLGQGDQLRIAQLPSFWHRSSSFFRITRRELLLCTLPSNFWYIKPQDTSKSGH